MLTQWCKELNEIRFLVVCCVDATDSENRAVVVPLSANNVHLTINYDWFCFN
jgi:hypothetical protein